MQAEAGSGIRFMSDSWIAFQPAIDDPSNMMPSAKVSSSMVEISTVTCCHLPRGSVKRKSTNFTSLSLIIFRTSLAVVIHFPFVGNGTWKERGGSAGPQDFEALISDGVQAGFTGPESDGLLDAGDEDLAVTNAAGLRGTADGLDGFVDHIVGQHNLDFDLGKKVHHVLGSAVELGVTLLAAEALGLGHRDTLQPYLLQRLLHFVELEGFDDGLDFFHRHSVSRAARRRPQPPAGC